MSELRLETWTMPAADVGRESPLPPLRSGRDVHAKKRKAPDVPEEMLRNMNYGRVPSILPYTMQDGYTREKRPQEIPMAVLENDILKASFLLPYGGRLWSLVHKPSGRELLEVNPVFQPANLALRNAWFSGGVEWNICTTGHWPYTVSPLFAARLETDDGTPVLRQYEWERIRQVPFQIDAYLPDGSPMLFVRIRILNPHSHEVPMYWWSNIAVPETRETRVVVPADSAFKWGYGKGGLGLINIPDVDGVDISYSTHINRSADFFFNIDVENGQRPWITALDETGRGLIQTSTRRLRGRKLFLWGQGPGGRRWQTFLSEPGHAYIEIQAGLARTQMEHVPMPAEAEWSWLEAYGLMEADPEAVHGDDWTAARQAVETQLENNLLSWEAHRQAYEQGEVLQDRPPEAILQRGSGWGALEQLRREHAGEASFATSAWVFDAASMDEHQAPWVTLLETGKLPAPDPQTPPVTYMVQDAWREMVEKAVEDGEDANWFTWLQLGVMRYYAGDREGARAAWEASLEASESAWAMRNLALLAWEEERFDEATERYVAALRLYPQLPQLAIEAGRKLLDMGRPQAWLSVLPVLPDALRRSGRIRLLEGEAALAAGELERVGELFEETLVIDDLREGERSLSHLWFEYHARRLSREEGVPIDDELRARVEEEFPVPPHIDFRMSTN